MDNAIFAIRSALANQMSWPDIQDLVKNAQANKDPVALCVKQLKLEVNHISLYLTDPYTNLDSDEDDNLEEGELKLEPMTIDVDLALSAYSNATRYYDQRRGAVNKEKKTIEASVKALKNAEKKTQQTLKDVRTQSVISKVSIKLFCQGKSSKFYKFLLQARKVYWFEKFYWFISSENYLVIGGRDQQQNELIVKRYMRAADIYVHAEIQGASSVLIKNPSGAEIPPKTLLEAGTMAISYSVAWEAKVVTSAYWVRSEQVSKTAPTGEYLSTGSFMIRGKKNFLPPCHLILGLSFLFKLEESSVERHKGERRVRKFGDEDDVLPNAVPEGSENLGVIQEDVEIELIESDGEKEGTTEQKEVLDSDNDENAEGINYPDTHIQVEHVHGKVTVKSDPKLERKISIIDPLEEMTLVEAAPLKVKAFERKLKQTKKVQPVKVEIKEEEGSKRNDNQPKRGHKAKAKKIKEKYGDQDEEERVMRMEILKVSLFFCRIFHDASTF